MSIMAQLIYNLNENTSAATYPHSQWNDCGFFSADSPGEAQSKANSD